MLVTLPKRVDTVKSDGAHTVCIAFIFLERLQSDKIYSLALKLTESYPRHSL